MASSLATLAAARSIRLAQTSQQPQLRPTPAIVVSYDSQSGDLTAKSTISGISIKRRTAHDARPACLIRGAFLGGWPMLRARAEMVIAIFLL